jgi:hypothetical protein
LKSNAVVLVLSGLLLGTVFADQGARYLVVAQDDLVDAVRPLVEWRNAQGLQAIVVPTSTTGTTLAEIDRYIKDAWDDWPVPPEFVLLVAHPSVIPAARYGWPWTFYTDNDYADVSGDYQAEIAVGRFPAHSAAQVEVMVAKTLSYEKSPDLTDTLWMRRLTMMVREEGDANDTLIYWGDVRHAAVLAGANGFVGCDSFSRFRGDDSLDVYASLERGTGFVMYRGSAVGNWANPFRILPHLTTNYNRLPVVLSVTCATMALDPYDSMVGRAWVMAGSPDTLIGAVAFYGNSRIAHWISEVRSVTARGFFTALFTDDQYILGTATLRTKELLFQAFPQDTDEYRGFNLFGDPGLRLWTGTPRHIDVVHPDTIPFGPQDLTVSVSLDGSPVQDAIVCASMDTTVYVCDTTDAQGTATMQIAPTGAGVLRLVVTGQNLLPYDGSILVRNMTGIAERQPVQSGPAQLFARPSAFRSKTQVHWSVPARPGWSLCLVDVLGRETESLTKLQGDRAELGARIPAGVYLAMLRDAQGRLIASTRLTKLH